MTIKRTSVHFLTIALLVLSPGAFAQGKLQLEVYTGRGVVGYDVNSTLISGEKDMLLIDAQLALSEAHKLAAKILESKKNLAIIYITHPHPDHMFGLAVLKQAFPQARILALPQTVNAAKTGWPSRQKFWLPTYGNNIPGPEPVLPEELTTPYLELEGNQFPVIGPVGGSDGPGNSFVSIPQLKAVVTGDIVYDQVYFGVQKDKNREEWLKSIDQILALNPSIIVPGHEGPGSTRSPATIAFMKKYVADWDANVARSKNAQEMRKNTLKKYPKLGMEFALDQRVAAYFPAQPAPGSPAAPAR
jgi:glyoxylase-like metal-dependent hydrolase (beta-lactamase superfamily II)